jgi:hypothetical protein
MNDSIITECVVKPAELAQWINCSRFYVKQCGRIAKDMQRLIEIVGEDQEKIKKDIGLLRISIPLLFQPRKPPPDGKKFKHLQCFSLLQLFEIYSYLNRWQSLLPGANDDIRNLVQAIVRHIEVVKDDLFVAGLK